MDYSDYPKTTVEDIVRLRRCIAASTLPVKQVDKNLLIGSWNIRGFGEVYKKWSENPRSPKRNLRGLACIAEIVRCFDVVAIQEVKGDTSGIRMLLNDFLGPDWGVLMSDVTAGDKGNDERLTYVYDKRRVQPTGLAGEIVLPDTPQGDPQEQFDRTPYIVGFQSNHERFALLTAHIKYGDQPIERLDEIKNLADFIATKLRDRAKSGGEEKNLIVLGDFNIDERKNNPLFQAFVSTGLYVPPQLLNLKTTYATEPKFYDQIAWFRDDLDLLTTEHAGVINFTGAIFQEMTPFLASFRVSDHFPLWVEFQVDRSTEQMAKTLGVDPANPNPFADVKD
jgi:endonuclease/exonuclease/phosphatase family metal-dependent hydrolase